MLVLPSKLWDLMITCLNCHPIIERFVQACILVYKFALVDTHLELLLVHIMVGYLCNISIT